MSRYLSCSRLINASPMLLALSCGTLGILAAGPVWAQEAIPIQPATVYVPSENFPTIQDAIDAVPNFSIIKVRPTGKANAYSREGFRDLDFRGKNLVIKNDALNPGKQPCILDLTNSPGSRAFNLTAEQGSYTLISGFTIRGANVDTANGGAILSRGSSAHITHCVFERNTAANGAAIYFDGGGNPVIENCTFKENTGTGAIAGNDPGLSVTLKGVRVSGQQGGYGYGVWFTSPSLENGPMINIDKCTVDSNVSGGLYLVKCASVSITRTFVRSNTGNGALWMRDCPSLYVANCAFGKNKGGMTGGIDIYNAQAGGRADITDSTFFGNLCDNNTGLANNIFISNVNLRLINSILWSPEQPNHWELHNDGDPQNATVVCCAVRPTTDNPPQYGLNKVGLVVGFVPLFTSPFVNYDSGNIRLNADTPCRGAATGIYDEDGDGESDVVIPPKDITGYTRNPYPKRDLGAYEYPDPD